MLTIWAASMPQEDMLNYLRYNFVGNILPFAIGIYMARHGVCLSRKRNIFCALLWILSWFNAYLWVFSPTLFLLAILPVCSIEGTWRNLLLWLGGLSACLFVIHPIVRPYIIKGIKDGINPYIGLFLYTFITFIMSLAYQTMLKFIPKPRKTL